MYLRAALISGYFFCSRARPLSPSASSPFPSLASQKRRIKSISEIERDKAAFDQIEPAESDQIVIVARY
jgi:hypothetical protein